LIVLSAGTRNAASFRLALLILVFRFGYKNALELAKVVYHMKSCLSYVEIERRNRVEVSVSGLYLADRKRTGIK
jgi:hypothetical protein